MTEHMQARELLSGTLPVISGDALTDIDLGELADRYAPLGEDVVGEGQQIDM